MNRAMSRPARPFAFALLFSSLVAVFVVGASPASACSCATRDLGARLPDADGAFVGTYLDRSGIGVQRVAFTFEVERVVKGDFGPTAIVRTDALGASCGLESFDDRRTGLLLRLADDGVWESDLCSMVEPSALLALGGEEPDPGVAAVSAGWSTTTKAILVGAGLVLLIVLAMLVVARAARRRGSSPEQTGVA
jgi:hypothetical protein